MSNLWRSCEAIAAIAGCGARRLARRALSSLSAGHIGSPDALTHSNFTGSAPDAHKPAAEDATMAMMNGSREGPAQDLRRADGTAIRVLVVDDEPTLTELLSMALRYEGWQVRTAGAGAARPATPRSPSTCRTTHDLTTAVGTALADGPPHRSQRAGLLHSALTLGVWQRSALAGRGR
jgi:hypothetical protein